MKKRPGIVLLLLCLVGLQAGFWWETRSIKPDLAIVPSVPRTEAVQALSLGDEQLYFRVFALRLQNMGDLFGRFTPLKHYDYAKLAQWFTLLDALDARSNMVPNMAAYYFSQTQNTPDTRYIVDYLYDHATHDIAHKWWWLVQSIYLAMNKLEDMDLTMKIVEPLLDPSVPVWAQQFVAIIHEKRGEMGDALRIMELIKENATHISDNDLKYMRYFVEERLKALDALPNFSDPKPAP
jgi:hypothetical protein